MQPKYQRVPSESWHQNSDIEMTADEPKSIKISVKILFKEKTIAIEDVFSGDTVGRLKELVEAPTGVKSNQQRLICAGKPLKVNSAKLFSMGVVDGTSIHLFPLPATAAAPATPPVSAVPATRNPILIYQGPTANVNSPVDAQHQNEENDPDNVFGEVKLWCLLLLCTSTFSLFNNMMYFFLSGRFGVSIMDDIVNVVEACASLAGIYVSRMGLAAVVDLRIQEVDKYVKSLLCLGAVCICLRILWVVDMLFLVEKAVNEEQESPSDTDPYAEQPQNADDDPETRRRLVPVVLIQASVIAGVIIWCWMSCLRSAVRLRNRVDVPAVSPPAVVAV